MTDTQPRVETLKSFDKAGAAGGHITGSSDARSTRDWRTATYLIPVVSAVGISQTWFRSGTFIAGGDLAPFLVKGLELEYGSHWNHLVSGAGSPNFQISLAAQVLAIKVIRSMGGSEYIAQRVFYAVLLGSVAFGTVYFVRAFTSKPAPVVVAGLVGFLNPFVMTQAMNPLALLALASMGLLGGMLLRVGRGVRVSALGFAFATLGCSYLALNPPLLLVVVLWVVALALAATRSGPGAFKRIALFLTRCLPWCVILNLWWLVPMLLTLFGATSGPTFTAQTDVQAWSWTHVRNSIPNVLGLNTSWAWDFNASFPLRWRLGPTNVGMDAVRAAGYRAGCATRHFREGTAQSRVAGDSGARSRLPRKRASFAPSRR